eukprot:2168734-Alexandrium_andersonii.AAC.1
MPLAAASSRQVMPGSPPRAQRRRGMAASDGPPSLAAAPGTGGPKALAGPVGGTRRPRRTPTPAAPPRPTRLSPTRASSAEGTPAASPGASTASFDAATAVRAQ